MLIPYVSISFGTIVMMVIGEGMIVSHKEKGGIGVVCTCPPCEREPAEKYVSWVFKPREAVSIWLSGREKHFIRRSPM